MKIYIKEIRMQKAISSRVLAKKSGVSRSHIVAIESGQASPTLEVMCKIAKVLDVPVADLFACEE